jgi:hypothetical protein
VSVDQDLMQSIKTKYGDVISAAGMNSNVPAPFLAALIANETGGNPLGKRFEGNVLVSLWKVVQGRVSTFGVFHASDLLRFVGGLTAAPGQAQGTVSDAFARLDDLATSWGLTQIMGYHALEKNSRSANLPSGYQTPSVCLAESIRLLTEFAEHFQFDVSQDFEAMFRCWNGGHPTAQTFDPQYVPNGKARMAIYAGLG